MTAQKTWYGCFLRYPSRAVYLFDAVLQSLTKFESNWTSMS